MALEAHIETLNQRHEELEAAIATETKHPGFDEFRVNQLKRQKLRIKDQLEELQPKINPN